MGDKKRSRGDSLGHGAFYEPVGDEERAAASESLARELAQLPREELVRVMQGLEEDMRAASAAMDFEQAALLRDRWCTCARLWRGRARTRLSPGSRRTPARARLTEAAGAASRAATSSTEVLLRAAQALPTRGAQPKTCPAYDYCRLR